MNVQIYFHRKSEDLQRISQEKKRDIFVNGLVQTVSSVKELKTFILEHKYFGIIGMEGSVVKKEDGSVQDGEFVLFVDDQFQATSDREIFCLFSTVDHVFFNDHSVSVKSILTTAKIPKGGAPNGGANQMNADVKARIKQLVDLFGRGAENLGTIVSDADIDAVSFLEKVLSQ